MMILTVFVQLQLWRRLNRLPLLDCLSRSRVSLDSSGTAWVSEGNQLLKWALTDFVSTDAQLAEKCGGGALGTLAAVLPFTLSVCESYRWTAPIPAAYALRPSGPCSKLSNVLTNLRKSSIQKWISSKSSSQFIIIETTTGVRNDNGYGTHIDLNATGLLLLVIKVKSLARRYFSGMSLVLLTEYCPCAFPPAVWMNTPTSTLFIEYTMWDFANYSLHIYCLVLIFSKEII